MILQNIGERNFNFKYGRLAPNEIKDFKEEDALVILASYPREIKEVKIKSADNIAEAPKGKPGRKPKFEEVKTSEVAEII